MLQRTFSILTILAIAVALLGAAAAQSRVERQPMDPDTARLTDGEELYMALCATCHGRQGVGDGPAASALKMATPDLTVLARRNQGEYPAAELRMLIEGDRSVAAHGSADMPVWGSLFTDRLTGSKALTMLRINNLVNYLETIQKK